MRADGLTQTLLHAFATIPRPARDEIVSHACAECFRIRDDFAPHAWPDVPASVFEYHWGSFPLFTPEAFRYYIPGYLKHMLEHPQSEIAGWTIER